MSAILSSISTQRADAADGSVQSASGFVKRWWLAYITWRVERLAAARLRTMSDRQLKDMGIVRSDIEFAVRRGSARGRIINLFGLCLCAVCLGV